MTAVTAARPVPGAAEQATRYVAILLGALVMFAFLGPILSYKPQPFTGEGNPFRQLCYLMLFGGALLASGGALQPRRLLVIPAPIVFAMAWCVLSLTWSQAAGIGLRRFILTVTVIWSVFLVVRQAGYERSVAAVRWALVAALVINYLALVAVPRVAIHQAAEFGDPGLVGDWAGFMGHKNFAGPACAFTILFFTLTKPQMRAWLRAAVLIAAAYFLYRTHSKTSLSLTAVGLVAAGAFQLYDARYRHLILPAIVSIVALGLLVFQKEIPTLLEPLSRPDALTGRGQIWPVLLAYVRDNPWTGTGYGSFWNVGADSPAFDYGRGWVVEMASGHNGYLDLMATIGAPGLVLVVFATILAPLAKLLGSTTIDKSRGRFLFAMMVFCIGHNMTESTLFDRDLIVEVFLMITIALVYLSSRPSEA